MSIDDLDLDINNYNMKDLEKFFGIFSNGYYNAEDIEEKEYAMRTLLLSSGEVSKKQQKDLIDFLSLAKDWLIFVKCKPKEENIIQSNAFNNGPTIRKDELNKRNDTVYVNTQNSDAFPGIINPLNSRIITKSLNVDTRFRDNYLASKSTDFIYNLPTKLNKVISMHLSSVEIPINFYGISEYLNNNYLYLKVTHVDNFSTTDELTYTIADPSLNFVISEKMITVPDGNYNAEDFMQLINSLIGTDFENVNTDDIFKFIQLRINITPDGSGTAKVIVEGIGFHSNKIKSIELDFRKNKQFEFDKSIPYNYRIGTNLGFLKPTYIGYPDITGDTIVEPSYIRYLYLIIDDYNNNVNNHFIGVFNKSIMDSNILARISVKGSYFSLMMNDEYSVTSEPRKYFGPVDIQKIRIRLTDEFGRTIELNNSDFSFCLNFRLLYDL